MSGTVPPTSLSSLASATSAVSSSGFLDSLPTIAPLIAKAVQVEDPSTLIEQLYGLMLLDPKLRPIVEQARAEASAMAASSADEPATHTQFAGDVASSLRANAKPFPDILEGNGQPVLCVTNAEFQNWGRTVENTPYLTCIPTTRVGVCNIVKWATQNQKTVRVSGYRHTWNDFYSSAGEVLISLLPLDVVNDLPAQEPAMDPLNELQGISVNSTGQCKIGSATTNEQFRRWCLAADGGNWNWTVPLNVIMVEITFGGSNAPICHGAGLRHETLSDLVVEIEFVNALGNLQTVNDPALLPSASGAFGLLGIVTSITLQLEAMTYANMQPAKVAVPLTIPPPAGFTVPSQINMSGITQQQLDAAWQTFVNSASNDYYAEWFWFPYQAECWINTWTNDGQKSQAVDYPGEVMSFIEAMEEYLGQLANETIFRCFPGWLQASILGGMAMVALPSDQTIVTPVIDALHFRRGIQNMRVLDTELEIPLPPSAADPTKPDFSIAQQAWWDAISIFYSQDPDKQPMRIALEMRIMGGSNVTLAPQYGNSLGTCSIEVLTPTNVDASDWAGYMQQIADKWTSYGARVRPHWAKQWPATMYGVPTPQYLSDTAYAAQLPKFKADLQAIATAGGFTLQQVQQLFTNATINTIFASVFS